MRQTFTPKVLAAVLTIAALMAGHTTAQAETKTVTYTITSAVHNSTNNTYDIVFTRSGDAFNTSAPTTFTTSVSSSSIGQSPGYNGNFHVVLADGFEMSVSWESGSNVTFDNNNYISPGVSGKQITYNVSCTDDTYYVTHVTMHAPNGNWEDANYDNQWRFSQNYATAYKFGAITITYANTPPLSVFQSAGTKTYNIRNKEELRHLANYVNGGNDCKGLTFLQTQDITCDDTYMPIGNSSNGFRGTYNGQGNTVSGITVSRATDRYIGLFAYVIYGKVENVILSNSTFTGSDYIGGIVGYNDDGTVQNCRVENTVTILAGYHEVQDHGGIVGYSGGSTAKVIGCISGATVSCNDKKSCIRYGGIVGEVVNSGSTIKDCLYTGTSVDSDISKGAILGYRSSSSSGTLTNNYYTSINLGGVQGNDADGARRARTVTLGENITLVGDETPYSVSGLTAIGTTALRHGSTIYSGEGQTLTLGYSNVPTGYTLLTYTATSGGNDITNAAISGNVLTMPAGDVTINALLTANTYTVTLDNQGATTAGTAEVTATYDAAMPAIIVPTRTGYTFGGYYTAAYGGGTKYYNADGTSAGNWDIAGNTTLYALWIAPLAGYGTEANPYVIGSADDWELFADLAASNAFVGEYFRLDDDINVSEMASTNESYGFSGNFDGNGHKITLALSCDVPFTGSNEQDQGLALFRFADDGCTIHDLTVDGTITTVNKFAAGFISYITDGTSGNRKNIVLRNCRSSVSINSTVSGDATSAGFVAISKQYVNLTLEHCLFDGSFVSSTATQFAGFVGWQDIIGLTTITYSVVAPASIALTAANGNHRTFCRSSTNSNLSLTNSYYCTAIGIAQGTKGYTITADPAANMTLTGETGLQIGSTIYAASGETVSLTMTDPNDPPTGYTTSGSYNATAAVHLSGSGTDYTLTMPSENVYITCFTLVTYDVTYHLNGGTLPDGVNNPSEYNILSNDITLPTPTSTGLPFFGWYDNEYLMGDPVTTIPAGSTGNKEFWAKYGKDIADCTVTIPDQMLGSYSYINYKFEAANQGNAIIGELVKDGETTLTLGIDYEFGYVTYVDMTGHNEWDMPEEVDDECIVEIKGKGDYAGYKCAIFTIVNPSGNGTWGDNLSWVFANGTLTITGTGVMDAAASYAGYPWYPFASYVSDITIGEGVTSVAGGAFATAFNDCHYTVSTVSLPTTLTSIGEDAFAYCTGATITIPTGITIGSDAFLEVKKVIGSLSDNADNTGILNRMFEAKKADVTLAGRTLWQDGDWNTLCLPFSIANINAQDEYDQYTCPLHGATLKELDVEGYYNVTNGEPWPGQVSYDGYRQTGFDAESGTLYLYFKAATSITAGVPYIIKWASGDNLTENDLVFTDVQILSTTPATVSSADAKIDFTGNYSPVPFTANDQTILFLGGSSMLYYPSTDLTANSCRAYFQLNGITASPDPSQGGGNGVKAFVLNFGEEDDPDGIRPPSISPEGERTEASPREPKVDGSQGLVGAGIYDLFGRRYESLPSGRFGGGRIYIVNGRKIVVK